MLTKYLPASLLATALFAGGLSTSAYAGHAMSESTHGQVPHFVAHHGFMKGDNKKREPAKLGVAIAAIPQIDLDAMALEYGVRIEDVREGSVAENAGLKAGDVVTDVDDRPVYSPARMQHLVNKAAGVSTIALTRNGKSLRLQAEFSATKPADTAGKAVLGIRIQEMTEDLKDAFGARGNRGVLISQVMGGSAAKQAGLKAGDVIVTIGGDSITTVSDVHRVLSGYKPGETVPVSVLRDREEEKVQVALGDSSATPKPQVANPQGMPGHGNYGQGFHGSQSMMSKHRCHRDNG